MTRDSKSFSGILRRWLGNTSSRAERTKTPKLPAKPVRRWLVIEQFEDRVMPDIGFATIASKLATQFDTLSSVAVTAANQSTAVLPILGSKFADQATQITKAVTLLKNEFTSVLGTLNGTASQKAIKTALSNSGIVRDLDGNNKVNNDDVLISEFNTNNGTITITARLGKTVTVMDKTYQFDLGLPGVPFGLTGNSELGVSLDIDYDRVSFGMRGGQFFIESPARTGGTTNTLKVSLAASATKTSLYGTMGFFQVTGTAIPGWEAAQVKASLVFDANGASFTSPRLAGSADVNLNLDAAIVSNASGMTFPHMETDFQMSWPLGGAHNAGLLGSAPSVAFNNIRFGLGSFLGSMVKPIAEKVQLITAPMTPVYELLRAKLPGLSDLSEAVGTGSITLDKLANLAVASKVLPPDYQLLADIGIKLHTLIGLLRDSNFGPSNDVLIPVGSFNLSGNGDLRRSTLAGGYQTLKQWAEAGLTNFSLKNLTDLVPYVTSVSESIERKIELGDFPPSIRPAVRQAVQDTFRKINETLRKAGNGIGLSFPLLENPVSVYKLLLGQDVDFARFDAKFEGTASQKDKIKVWGPIDAGFEGTIFLNAELHVAVDTFGLRTFFMDIAKGNPADPSKLDDGLYVDSSKELVRIIGKIEAQAGIDQNFGTPLQFFAFLGFSGKVETNPEGIVIRFVDPNQRGDHKLRVLKSGELGNSLFTASGSLSANFNFKVEAGVRLVISIPIGEDIVLAETRKTIYHKTFFNGELFRLDSVPTRNPFNDPIQNVGLIDVIYDVNFKAGANDGRDDTIRAQFTNNWLHLYYNGVRTDSYRLANVRSLKIIGSDDNDEIKVEKATEHVKVDGRGGEDTLDFDDSGWNTGTPIYTVSESGVGRFSNGFVSVFHDNLEKVFVTGSNRRSTYHINSNPLFTLVFGGDADDTFSIGSSDKSLDGDLSPIIFGGGGFNRLFLDDSAGDYRANYTIGHESLTRSTVSTFYSPTTNTVYTYQSSFQVLEFFDIGHIELKGTSNGNTIVVDDLPDPRLEDTPRPMTIDVYAGGGIDDVRVLATTDTLDIFGESGRDVVTVGGLGYGTRFIYGDVKISNSGSYTTINVDDTSTTTGRTILMDTNSAGDRGFLYGFTGTALGGFGQSRISYTVSDTLAVNVNAGSGSNTVSVADTARRNTGDPLVTTIRPGSGSNSVYVGGTSGNLTIEAQGSYTGISIGALPDQDGRLSRIKGPVTLRGKADVLTILDTGTGGNTSTINTMDASHFFRNNLGTGAEPADIYFGQLLLSSFSVTLGNARDTLLVDGTPPLSGGLYSGVVNLFTGGGNDIVHVRGTNGPISLNLEAGSNQAVSIGNESHSLDAIKGNVFAYGRGFIDALVSNAASTVSQKATLTAPATPFSRSQSVTREVWNGDHWDLLNTIRFGFSEPSRLTYAAGQVGDEIHVRGSLANVPVNLTSGAGQDHFHIEVDQAPLLAPVNVNGNRSTLDVAYYEDFNTATPQNYTLDRQGGKNRVARGGTADVFYSGLMQLIPTTARNGGNQVSVRDIPAEMRADLFVADNDAVTVGRPTPMGGGFIGGTMNPIQGLVTVAGGKNVSLVLDDVAALSGRNATLHTADGDGAESITGMGPGVVRWTLDETSSVDIRGGRFNDNFAVDGVFKPSIRIDGGPGTNTLDYSNYEDNTAGPVSWYRGEFDFTDAIGSHDGTGVNGAGFAEAGISGGAFSLDGIDDYVVIPNHADFAPAALTLEARISPVGNAMDGNRVIVSKYDDNDPGGSGKSWVLSVVDGHVRFGVYQGSNGRVIQTNETISSEGFWQHIAATFDPATSDMKIYVDGQELECTFLESFEVTAINPSETPVRIGAQAGDVIGGFFSGRIDDVRIYARALTPAEVQANEAAGNDGPPSGTAEGIRVNLPLGTASSLTGGISNIQNVIGSAFDDILIGNGGNVLSGGAGRDFLVAGRTASKLNGGEGEDILIGGFLYADDDDGELNPDAIEAIAAEWFRRDVNYAIRSETLQNLLAGPMIRNGGVNELMGQGDLDLFFANEDDLGDWNGVELRVTG